MGWTPAPCEQPEQPQVVMEGEGCTAKEGADLARSLTSMSAKGGADLAWSLTSMPALYSSPVGLPLLSA